MSAFFFCQNSSARKDSLQVSTPTSSTSRSDRAKRRGAMEDITQEPPTKKPAMTPTTSKRTAAKTPASEKAAKCMYYSIFECLSFKFVDGIFWCVLPFFEFIYQV